MAWPVWVLYAFVTGATFLIFVGFLRKEFDYKVH